MWVRSCGLEAMHKNNTEGWINSCPSLQMCETEGNKEGMGGVKVSSFTQRC